MAAKASTLQVEVVGDASKLRKTLDGVSGRMRKFGDNVAKVGGTMTKWVSGPIAGAVGGLAMLAKKEGERADALLDAQARTQASLETLQEYEHVASQAGVAQDFFQSATKDMSRQLASAAQGGKRASAAFGELGIDIRDANGEVRSTADLTEEAMQKLAGMSNESKAAAIAQDLFKSSQQDVLAVVSQGADEIARQRQEAHELGVVQSEESLKGANEFRKGLERLQARFAGLASQIGGRFAPVLTDHVLPLFEDRIVPMLSTVGDKIASVIEWFADLDPRLQAIIAGAVGLVAALGPMLLVVGKVVAVASSLGPVLAAIKPALLALTGPVGLVVVAVGALIAGLVLAYQHSETFRNIVQAVFGAVADFVPVAVDAVKTALTAFVKLATRLWARWGDDILAIARSAWDAVAALIERVVAIVGGIIRVATAAIQAVWRRWGDDILAFAVTTWNNIKTMIDGVLTVIRGIFEVFAGLFSGDWSRMWEGVKTIASGVWTFLEGAFDQLLATLGTLARIGLEALQAVWNRLWQAITDYVRDRIDDVVEFMRALPGRARTAIAGAWDTLSGWITRQFSQLKDDAVERATEIVDWFGDLPGKIIDAIGDLGGTVGSWLGDQLDRLPIIGGGGPEVNAPAGAPAPGEGAMPPGGSTIGRLNSFMDSTGIPHRTTSEFRPGDDGFHGTGRAVDFAGARPGRDTANLRAIQQSFVPLARAGVLKELIGPIASMNYKNGRQFPYSPATQIAHDNHVHTAMARGGLITEPVFGVGRSGRTYEIGEAGPERVEPLKTRGGDSHDETETVALLRKQTHLLAELVDKRDDETVALLRKQTHLLAELVDVVADQPADTAVRDSVRAMGTTP